MELVGKVMSLLFNMLSWCVIVLLPRASVFLMSWVSHHVQWFWSLRKKKKSVTVSIFSPPIAMKSWVQMPQSSFFEYWVLSQFFHCFLSLSSRGSSVPLCFLPEGWCHLHIWGYSYFSWQPWFQLVLHPARHFAWRTLHRSYINRVTIYSLDILLSQFGTSPLFHVWF